MKRLLSTVAALALMLVVTAQTTPREELRKVPGLSANNCVAYPEGEPDRLSPAPKGKRPCHLTHYGRHGSRYMINARDYDFVIDALRQGQRHQALSPLGEDVLARCLRLHGEAKERLGELSALGAEQHRAIARRMTERFPDLFQGEAPVTARSSTSLRCVLSMGNALQQLLSINPRLRIDHNASYEDMHYLFASDKELAAKAASKEVRRTYDDFCREHECWRRPTESLFSDTAYYRQMVNGERLNYYLFRLAGSVQNTDLRHELTLYDLYTEEEIYENWLKENAYWFLGYAVTPLNGGRQPYTQRELLSRIISDTDSCLALKRPGVMLRFGHETCLLPLVCLMDIDGYGQPVDSLALLAGRGWAAYRIFPMASNVQMVFYRANPADKDVLVKVLLNEREATLPLPSAQPPYYRWQDVRRYLLDRLDEFEKKP